jgi:hypothetical protein
MDEQTLLERLIAGRVNAVLDEVLTILETDDGKSFEEKKEEIDQLLSAKIEKPEASRDKGSVPNVTDTFWQQGEITVAEGLKPCAGIPLGVADRLERKIEDELRRAYHGYSTGKRAAGGFGRWRRPFDRRGAAG